jgi:hypothetical protein
LTSAERLARRLALTLNSTGENTVIKLKIDLEEPINAMTFRMEMTGGGWYLDTETGAILLDCDAGDEELPEDLRDNPRYRWIDPIESRDGFTLMEDFIETVTDSKVRERLDEALGACRTFHLCC